MEHDNLKKLVTIDFKMMKHVGHPGLSECTNGVPQLEQLTEEQIENLDRDTETRLITLSSLVWDLNEEINHVLKTGKFSWNK